MTLRVWMIGAALAASTLQGCAPMMVGAGAGAALSYSDRRTAGTQIEDEGIELRASSRINERFGDKVHVNVTSYNRSVLLTGEAQDARSRAAIEDIVRNVPNVRSLTNEIQVAGASTLGARTNDSFITSKVKARFVDANRFYANHVKVVTEAGVVYLMGIVTQKEADDAVEVTRTTGGVRKVVKIFEYCQPTEERCRAPAKSGS